MAYLNVKLSSGDICSLKYISEDSAYIFENDITINEWIICKIVGYSVEGYTRNYHLDFIIKDKHGIPRKHRQYTPWPRTYANDINSVSEFIENSLIFQCDDWDDYDTSRIINDIEKILSEKRLAKEKIIEIERLVSKFINNRT